MTELPNVVVEIQVSLATEAITLVGMYTETNSEDPVIRFYVTVAGNTVSTQPDSSSFSVSLGYDGLEPGTTYTVSVVAENVIGNGTVQTPQTFTVPGDGAVVYRCHIHASCLIDSLHIAKSVFVLIHPIQRSYQI